MELFLNLAGAFVALAIVCLWLRWRPRAGGDRRTQVVALALLILILFPVISVTDDLLAAQNPAETDTLVRRDLIACALHAASPLIAVLPEPPIAALPFGSLRFAAPGTLPLVAVDSPALDPIENRPPPTA
jgi:hypothetical protein